MGLEFLEKMMSPYEIKARFFPALLALIPIFAFAISIDLFDWKTENIIIVVVIIILLYLTTFIIRELGKKLEIILFDDWGGKPTTQALRHRDTTIDSITKSRYHAFLSECLSIKFPSKEEEESNPNDADKVYQSAIKWLIDKTRDDKTFHLLFQENISFGFYCNSLSIKLYAEIIAFITMLLPFIYHGVITINGIELSAFSKMSTSDWVTLGLSFLMLIIWYFFITKEVTKTVAFRYAEKLLQACDVLQTSK